MLGSVQEAATSPGVLGEPSVWKLWLNWLDWDEDRIEVNSKATDLVKINCFR